MEAQEGEESEAGKKKIKFFLFASDRLIYREFLGSLVQFRLVMLPS